MIDTEFSLALNAARSAVQLAGRMITCRTWSTNITQKTHSTFGLSSTSDTDAGAERFLIEKLRNIFPNAVCVGEESAKTTDVQAALNASLAFWIDPRDGTTEDSHELPCWCLSVGVMQNGYLTGGVVHAPDIRGGLTIVSDEGGGVHLAERGGDFRPLEQAVQVPTGAKTVIHLGLDVQRLNTYNRFIRELPKDLKPRGISPSGALGLALVAAGRIDAIVQSPQMPWDWAGAMAAILEEKLAVRPFRIVGEKVYDTDLFDPENFSTDKQTMGFVAGKGELVEKLFALLVQNYGA